jgi:hypothetical protein
MYSSRKYVPALFIISCKIRSAMRIRVLYMKHIANTNFICITEKAKSKEIHKRIKQDK